MTLMIFGRVKCILRVRMTWVGSVQCRRVLIFCLSALLLCVSASASVCELSCSLSHVYPVCNPTGSASATLAREVGMSETSAPHSHCGHVHKARQGNAANHNVEETSKCTDASCARVQPLSRTTNLNDAESGSVHFSVLASVPAVAFSVRIGTAKHEYALSKFLPLDPLSVSLRI